MERLVVPGLTTAQRQGHARRCTAQHMHTYTDRPVTCAFHFFCAVHCCIAAPLCCCTELTAAKTPTMSLVDMCTAGDAPGVHAHLRATLSVFMPSNRALMLSLCDANGVSAQAHAAACVLHAWHCAMQHQRDAVVQAFMDAGLEGFLQLRCTKAVLSLPLRRMLIGAIECRYDAVLQWALRHCAPSFSTARVQHMLLIAAVQRRNVPAARIAAEGSCPRTATACAKEPLLLADAVVWHEEHGGAGMVEVLCALPHSPATLSCMVNKVFDARAALGTPLHPQAMQHIYSVVLSKPAVSRRDVGLSMLIFALVHNRQDLLHAVLDSTEAVRALNDRRTLPWTVVENTLYKREFVHSTQLLLQRLPSTCIRSMRADSFARWARLGVPRDTMWAAAQASIRSGLTVEKSKTLLHATVLAQWYTHAADAWAACTKHPAFNLDAAQDMLHELLVSTLGLHTYGFRRSLRVDTAPSAVRAVQGMLLQCRHPLQPDTVCLKTSSLHFFVARVVMGCLAPAVQGDECTVRLLETLRRQVTPDGTAFGTALCPNALYKFNVHPDSKILCGPLLEGLRRMSPQDMQVLLEPTTADGLHSCRQALWNALFRYDPFIVCAQALRITEPCPCFHREAWRMYKVNKQKVRGPMLRSRASRRGAFVSAL